MWVLWRGEDVCRIREEGGILRHLGHPLRLPLLTKVLIAIFLVIIVPVILIFLLLLGWLLWFNFRNSFYGIFHLSEPFAGRFVIRN